MQSGSRSSRSPGSINWKMAHVPVGQKPRTRILARIWKFCLSFPETSERLSHGAPAFFIRGQRSFVTYMDNHRGDGRLALWCASTREMQRMLVEDSPKHYFIPPYVGHRGWIGVHLDRDLGWDKIAGVIEDAYLATAPKGLIEAARRR